MLVHPAALRPIPVPLASIVATMGLCFLLAIIGISRQPADLSVTSDDVRFDGFVPAIESAVSAIPVRVTSVRSNTVVVDLPLVANSPRVGDRGGIYFRRADGKIFPIVREAMIERAPFNRNEPTSIFLSSADSLLVTQLSGAGMFLWKGLADDDPGLKRVERSVKKLLLESPPVSAALLPSSPSSDAVPASLPQSGERESIIWFPGASESFSVHSDGTVERILPNGRRTKVEL